VGPLALLDGGSLSENAVVMAEIPVQSEYESSLYSRRSAHLPELGPDREHWVEFELDMLRKRSVRPRGRRKYKRLH